jgi:hypothetical protein
MLFYCANDSPGDFSWNTKETDYDLYNVKNTLLLMSLQHYDI